MIEHFIAKKASAKAYFSLSQKGHFSCHHYVANIQCY